jgi:heptosyltransferase-1
MNILIVKLSSLGDVLHALPMVSDMVRHVPDVTIDWVVEEAFVDIVRLHTAVKSVIPIALRRWRKTLWRKPRQVRAEWRNFCQQLQATEYDVIIDCQSLIKSAMVARLANRHPNGRIVGYAANSCAEPLAACAYTHAMPYPPRMSVLAIQRYRDLAAWALGYTVDHQAPIPFELQMPLHSAISALQLRYSLTIPYVIFAHGTAQARKEWSQAAWLALGRRCIDAGLQVVLPWGNAREQERAHTLAADLGVHALCLPQRLAMSELVALIAGAAGVVGVDTGITHIAGALGRPTIGIFVDTDPQQAGVQGLRCLNACNPDMQDNAVLNKIVAHLVSHCKPDE